MQGGYGSFPPGMQGGMGANGNIHPLGFGMGHTTIYAVVESGQPIIMNPKTGEPYPPGYIPSIQDPNTWEQWQPGQSWAETMGLAQAELQEGMRQAQETLIRPGEEAAAETAQTFMQDLSKAANKWSGQSAESLYGKNNKTLQQLQKQAGGAGKAAISQAPKVAQSALKSGSQMIGQMTEAAKQITGSKASQPRMGGMTSALTSVAPESSPNRTPRAGISQQGAPPMTGGRTPSMTQRRN